MEDLTKIYHFNKDIAESRERILVMIYNEHQRGETINKRRSICIENLRVRINKLALIRHDQLMKVYSHVKLIRNVPPPSPLPPLSRRLPGTPSTEKLPIVESELESSSSSFSSTSSIRTPTVTPRSQSGSAQMKIAKIDVKDDFVDIQMVPTSFQHNQEPDKLDDDIIYPEGVIDLHPYETVARYRKAIGESTNFREHPLLVGEDSTETLILGLESFAQQHGCELSFTNEDQQFDQSVYRAACGIADLGSIHLLATDYLLTANFQFEMDLDYDTEFAQSEDNIQKFAFDFCEAISNVLGCENTYVRVFSINKLADEPGKSQVNFGLTTPEPKRTEQLAHDLQVNDCNCIVFGDL